MAREIIAASKIRTAMVEVLKQEWRKDTYQKGHYASVSPTALRDRVRKHLRLTANQVIRDKEWEEAVRLGVDAKQIRQNPNRSLVFTPPA